MMVTFVSQCEKNALKKTRRVLDAFANRIGDNTWQTVITEEGLKAVKKLLRKTVSKNTAVSCHWIRSRSRVELVWIVGSRDKFNNQGMVPVNTTKKMILIPESDWEYLPVIKALAALAALLHDWGKATALFQEKLHKQNRSGDPIRHEWISCLLLNALVRNNNDSSDDGWLQCLIAGNLDETQLQKLVTEQEKKPLHQLPPIAKLIAWLVVSHHRLPTTKDDWRGENSPCIDTALKRIEQSWGYENRQDEKEYRKRVTFCFQFPNGLLSQSPRWMAQVKKWAQRLQHCQSDIKTVLDNGSYRLLLHHSRLCLMLGDHYYSSQDADRKWRGTTGLFANTDRIHKKVKQELDEHLFGVAKHALRIAHLLPAFEKSPPLAHDIRTLKKASPQLFRWQDKAVDKIKTWRKDKPKDQHGFFAVNMASTGCGKTFANAKIMRALSPDEESLRYILALGLRTLTLQTGDEYRNRIGLGPDELAVLIGSKAVSDLHNQTQTASVQSDLTYTQAGSESEEPLLDEHIDYDCDIPEEGLATVLTQEKDRKFLYAPVLACTIDHIMAATECKRGGRYILPSLRLMSSDLVIDEIDDFTGSDLIAIGRLIHLAGMLGRKVMISSATIPPDLAEGYFNAYKKGWQLHSLTRQASCDIACVWIDEFKTDLTVIPSANSNEAIADYQKEHSHFIKKRVDRLSKQIIKRKAHIIECKNNMEALEFDEDDTKQKQYFSNILQAIIENHKNHNTTDPKSGTKVSFGVVRMANIAPCIDLTKFLLQKECPENIHIKTMAYHSQQVLLLRHEQEKHLDHVLKRKEHANDPPAAFKNPIIRSHLDAHTAQHMTFVLVATPVEEVGRDHDFDWAVIEPSSYRSIIQLAGRVRRHREEPIKKTNIALMQYNLKAFTDNDKTGVKYFRHPGYEETKTLKTHDLKSLVNEQEIAERLDAVPRIQKNSHINTVDSLAELEHHAIKSLLTNYQRGGPESLQGYLDQTWYLTALPQYLNPFRKGEPNTRLFLYADNKNHSLYFVEKDEKGRPVNRETILNIKHLDMDKNEQQNLWLKRHYSTLLATEEKRWHLDRGRCSLRFGELSLVLRDNIEYEYNDQFGLVKA